MRTSDIDAIWFACRSKACAPPPVGTGGSVRSGGGSGGPATSSAGKRRSTETVNLPGGGRARADQANRSSALSTPRPTDGAQKPQQSVAQRKRKMMLDSAAEEAGAAPRSRRSSPGKSRGLFGR
jgi:hypothetical protein